MFSCLKVTALTIRSDHYVNSPSDIYTLSSQKVLRILKLVRLKLGFGSLRVP